MPLGRGAALGHFVERLRRDGQQRERIKVIARACCKLALRCVHAADRPTIGTR
jgi:hypothetical protein